MVVVLATCVPSESYAPSEHFSVSNRNFHFMSSLLSLWDGSIVCLCYSRSTVYQSFKHVIYQTEHVMTNISMTVPESSRTNLNIEYIIYFVIIMRQVCIPTSTT